jgi:hypothetical protein
MVPIQTESRSAAMNTRAIKDFLLRSTTIRDGVTRAKEAYRHYRTDCYIISYPKCGRTWLRIMLAKALALHFDDPRETVWDPREVIEAAHKKGPYIQFTHDGVDYPPTGETKDPEKKYHRYKRKRVIFLIRDPRDVLVSYYFQRTRREGETHTLSDFLRHPWWGAARLMTYMRGWYEHRHIPLDFLLVRYEEFHRDAAEELRRILAFVDLGTVSDKLIESSVDYASFASMRKMSVNELVENLRLAPTDPQDPESFKVRKGKVGGYTEYLSPADTEYVEEIMGRDLPSVFGYTISKA